MNSKQKDKKSVNAKKTKTEKKTQKRSVLRHNQENLQNINSAYIDCNARLRLEITVQQDSLNFGEQECQIIG